ncbi:Pentatricopeptide repeat-containing protein-like [Abeliophyllum distichum]|uniref:Pentatricopeptide repeat-containing protein-like n=1 Tax=Abeliophyllum distichum TaxID=126358 RepID=A0ABD1W052_9LAMI
MTSLFQPIAYNPPELSLRHIHESKHGGKLSFQYPIPTQSISQSLPINQFSLPILNGPVNSTAYASVLEFCNCLRLGKQVHAHLAQERVSWPRVYWNQITSNVRKMCLH